MVNLGASVLWGIDGYPPPAFYFTVSLGPDNFLDTSFQEVSGIGPELETEDYVEGGENRYVHRLPTSVKHPKLVLKRGITVMASPLIVWCKAVLEGGLSSPIEPKLVHVSLMNENKVPVRVWSFANAFPVRWEVEAFNSTKNDVAIETIEMNYTYSTREV